jgi:glycosyltransferase involved in cell wall biosynthesis
MPKKIAQLELSEEIHPIGGLQPYDELRILVRYRGRPVKWISLGIWRQVAFSAERIREALSQQLGTELMQAALQERLSEISSNDMSLPPISVAVCASTGTYHLERCLTSLQELDYPSYEVIVVGRGARDYGREELAGRLLVRYVHGECAGQNQACNRAIAEARHEIVAFVTDDVQVDHRWLRVIGQSFSEPEVMAVTGLVAPAELETHAQMLLEIACGGAAGGLERRVIRRELLTSRNLLWANAFGSGANMAFRRSVFTSVGDFDITFDGKQPTDGGFGSLSGYSGDVEMLHRLVARGHQLLYEPAALVWRTYRRDTWSLRTTVYELSVSFGTYLIVCARNRTLRRVRILHFALVDWLGRRILRRLRRSPDLPRRLVLLELAGALLSPLIYRTRRVSAR